ncbi:MAG: hypothetical protein HS128_10185 [Ideonella sp.]|nr:hypothetical protein [Ideonella sp.]
MRHLWFLLLLASCSANVIQSTPNFVIVDHNGNRAGFSKALQAANAECAKYGKAASMDRQTCQGSCTTQFRCE